MKVSMVLSTSVVLFVFICAALARQPGGQPWLAVLSSTCRHRSTTDCIGVVLDNKWVLTTATCFRKCEVEIPHQLSVYVNIPAAAQKRLTTSIRLGSKVDGSLVWQHPEYNPNTFANDLALVKLACHNHTLENLNLASNCSAHESDGYIYAKNKVIKIKKAEGNRVKCFSKTGTSTWYHLASTLQMVATSSNNPDCMGTSICKHAEQLKSFMQGNEPNCSSNILPFILPVPLPVIIDDDVVVEINDTIIEPIQNITTIQLVSSTSVKVPEMTTSSQVASPTVIPTPVSVSTSTMVPVSTSVSTLVTTSTEMPTSSKVLTATTSTDTSSEVLVSTSSQIPTSTYAPSSSPTVTETSSILTEVPTSTQVSTSSQVPTSAPTSSPTLTETSLVPTEVPVSIETSTSTQVSEIPTSTKAATSTMIISTSTTMPTYSSTEITTLTQVSVSPSSVTASSTAVETSSSQAVISTQVPTQTPTSGCQLTIENGKASAKTIIPGFLLITYTCNQGYRFKSGTKPLTYGCTGGEMAIKPPPCELIACPPLEPLADGQVVVSGSGLGSTATYSCNEGFLLSDGFTVRVCKLNHEWSGKAGVCKRACPVPQSLVCNDGQRIFPSAFKYGNIGESASYLVIDGYALMGEDPVCQPDSTWSAPPKCLKLCNEKEVIRNATILIQRNASSYTREIVCDEGYEAVGHSKQRCTENGHWTPNFQKCTKTCAPITLVSGKVNMLKSASFLIAMMECNEGFHLEPALGAVVCTDGKWTPSIPRCVEDK